MPAEILINPPDLFLLARMASIKGKNTFDRADKAQMAEIKGKNTFDRGTNARMAEIKGKNTLDRGTNARMAEIKGKNTFDRAPQLQKSGDRWSSTCHRFCIIRQAVHSGRHCGFKQMYTTQRFFLLPVGMLLYMTTTSEAGRRTRSSRFLRPFCHI